jgi:hypothetical protein
VSAELAGILFYAFLAGGIATWFFALVYHRRAFRPLDPRDPALLRRGEVEVNAPIADVRDKAVQALRAGGLGGAGSVLLAEASDRRIAGEATWFGGKGTTRGARSTFEIDLREAGRTTFAEYRLRGSSGGGLRIASGLFVYLLGPAALVLAAVLIPTYVLGHGDPDVRAQAVQAAQTVHFLWPPFLFGWLRKKMATVTETALRNLLANTAF